MKITKNYLKYLSNTIVITILLSVFGTVFVSAEELPTYNAYTSFSTITQPTTTPWRYQVGYTNGTATVYENLTWNATDKYWGNVDIGIINSVTSDLVTGLPAIYLHTGGQRDPVVTFKAPFSGTIEISLANGGIYAPLNGAAQNNDGVNLFLYKQQTELFSKTGICNLNSNPEENRVFNKPITVTIRKNERLYFVVKPNKSTDNDSTYMNPQVKYTAFSNEAAIADTPDTTTSNTGSSGAQTNSGSSSVATSTTVQGSAKDGVYKFNEMFGPKTDPWFYYHYIGGVYKALAFFDPLWNGKDIGAPHAIISKTGWHPAPTGVTTLAFKSPKSGKIKIGMENTLILLSPMESADGTIVSVVSDSKLLCDQYWLTKEKPSYIFAPVEIDVYTGQIIYFYLSKAIGNSGDSTRIEPYIQYLEYKDVAVPKKDSISSSNSTSSSSSTSGTVDNTPVKSEMPNWLFIIFGAATTIVISGAVYVLALRKRIGK